MATTKRKAGDRWTVISIKPDGEAQPFQIGYWEDMSWPYLSQAEKIARDYQDQVRDGKLVVVPGGDSWGAARRHNNQLKRVQVCGVKVFLARPTVTSEFLPVRFCGLHWGHRKELMANVDGKVFHSIPGTHQWEPAFWSVK